MISHKLLSTSLKEQYVYLHSGSNGHGGVVGGVVIWIRARPINRLS